MRTDKAKAVLALQCGCFFAVGHLSKETLHDELHLFSAPNQNVRQQCVHKTAVGVQTSYLLKHDYHSNALSCTHLIVQFVQRQKTTRSVLLVWIRPAIHVVDYCTKRTRWLVAAENGPGDRPSRQMVRALIGPWRLCTLAPLGKWSPKCAASVLDAA